MIGSARVVKRLRMLLNDKQYLMRAAAVGLLEKLGGAPVIELHTGSYADSSGATQARELERLASAAKRAASLGLEVHAGHGLTYNNVMPVAAISEIVELNIGHCIIARAIFTGLDAAVRDMKSLMQDARR